MSIERERLRTEIAARRFRLGEIAHQIKTKVDDLREATSGYPFIRPDQLRAKHIAETAEEIETLQREYLQLRQEIEAGETELHG